jgi:basic membrane protein A
MDVRLPRGTMLRAALAFAASAAAGGTARAQVRLSVAALFAGSIQDGGFMQAGYDGLERGRARFGVDVSFVQGIAPHIDDLAAALRQLAAAAPSLIIAHGGQNNDAAKLVAPEFPQLRFVVTQGNVAGPNLSSYSVAQEQSAFLAGALAGLITRTGVVGHLSGIKVVPGLRARAAYAAGVQKVNPQAQLLTGFRGSQDDADLAARWTAAMLDQKVDVLFTMLNAGRAGSIGVCRTRHVDQIGNVVDWVATMPDVFVASAVADSGVAVLAAIEDLAGGRFVPAAIKTIGLERPDAVRLTLRPSVSPAVRGRLAGLAADLEGARIVLPTDYVGTEFSLPA